MEGCLKKLAIVALVMGLAMMCNPKMASGEGLCGMNDEGFKACGPSVMGPKPVDPSALCCSALSNADPACLCSYVRRYPGMMALYHVNPIWVLQLPAKCDLQDSFRC